MANASWIFISAIVILIALGFGWLLIFPTFFAAFLAFTGMGTATALFIQYFPLVVLVALVVYCINGLVTQEDIY